MKHAGTAILLAATLMLGASTSAFAVLKPKAALSQDWETLTINQQYTEFSRDEAAYTVKSTMLEKDALGEALGTVTAVGVTNKMIRLTHPAKIYAINGIADRCAVAVDYDNSGSYYVATCRSYMPTTLGTLIEDLNLKENMTIGQVSYQYLKNNERKPGNHIIERYTLDSAELLWETILSDTSIVRDLTIPNLEVGSMTIPIAVDVIGVEGYSIEVTMDGYLRINLLDTGKGFFIGKKVAQSFIKAVTETGTFVSRGVLSDDTASPDNNSVLGSKSVVK